MNAVALLFFLVGYLSSFISKRGFLIGCDAKSMEIELGADASSRSTKHSLTSEWVVYFDHQNDDVDKESGRGPVKVDSAYGSKNANGFVRENYESDFSLRAFKRGLRLKEKKRVRGVGTVMVFSETIKTTMEKDQNHEENGRNERIHPFFASENEDYDENLRLYGYENDEMGIRERNEGAILKAFKNQFVTAGPGSALYDKTIAENDNDDDDRNENEDPGGFEFHKSQEKKRRFGDRIECRDASYSWGLDRLDQKDLPLDGSFCSRKRARRSTTISNDGDDDRYDDSSVKDYFDVFVLDTGVDHRDSLGNPLFDVEVLYDYSQYDVDGEHDSDCNGHGTHIAGTVAGRWHGVMGNGNREKDISSSGLETRIRSVKMLDCDGYGDLFSLTVALLKVEGALKRRAEEDERAGMGRRKKPYAVVNMSLGSKGSRRVTEIEEIMERMWKRYGTLFVVSAGNYGEDACSTFPANVRGDFVLTVGSTSEKDELSYFSNHGECVDVFSPGSRIVSLKNVYGGSGRTKRYASVSESSTTMSGTSMSAGMVTGAYAYWIVNVYELPNGDATYSSSSIRTADYYYHHHHQSSSDGGGREWLPFVRDFKKYSFASGKVKPSADGNKRAIPSNDKLLSVPRRPVKMKWKDYGDAEEYEDGYEDGREYDGDSAWSRGPGGIKLWTPFSSLFSDASSMKNPVYHTILYAYVAIPTFIISLLYRFV